MSRALRRALVALGVAGLVGGLLVILTGASSDHGPQGLELVLTPIVAWSFLGAGLYAWARRPENRVGPLMTVIGFTWLLGALTASDTPAVHTVGLAFEALPYAVLAHLLLVFPDRALARGERALVVTGYSISFGLKVVSLFFDDLAGCGCPDNVLLVSHDQTAVDVLSRAQEIGGLVLLLVLAWVLRAHWRETPPAQRRAFAPVIVAGLATCASLVLTLVADLTSFDDDVEAFVDRIGQITLAAVPLGFLAGLLHTRLNRASAVGALVEQLAGRPRSLRDALAEALGDDTLELLFRRTDDAGWVDAAGRPATPPEGGWTAVERDGRVVGALVHSPALAEEDPAALRAAAAAAGLALENERLEAELRARIEELRESRARIVDASDTSRRRIERNLHDGAQQRLVALKLNLRLARDRVGDAAAAELLDESIAELDQATAELRELARGIHPAVLSDRGLGAALDALAARSAVPVELVEVPSERYPAPVESAAYFLVAEALTNVARYAQAGHASVRVGREDGHVVVEVRDDGVGGADPAAGSGLRGLADRLAALDGRLAVESPPGAGTTVRGEIPCAS